MIKLDRPACPHPRALVQENYKHPTNKQALASAAHDKCMYCESEISHVSYAHIEHIKPKAGDKYPELKYEWENLGYVCQVCNNIKSDKFEEDTPFIDPYSEDPSEHLFSVGPVYSQRYGSERGELTIREIELNRVSLIEKRQVRIEQIEKALNAAYRTSNENLRTALIEELNNETLPEKEFSMCVAHFLRSHDNR